MKIIVGLGNPGEQYQGTRHNLGFEVVEQLVKKLGVHGPWSMENKFKSEIIKIPELPTTHQELLLVKPTTYMNQSGLAVSALKNFYKVDFQDIVVIHDELDLLLGHLKIRLGGGAGGHHGVESIISQLGTDQFIRVRLGIANDKAFSGEHKRISFQAEKFVLETFLPQESSVVKRMIKKALTGLETLLDKGLEKAQNQFN